MDDETKGKKVRVGIVNYLNTKPLLYGLQGPEVSRQIELTGDYPARVAEMLYNDEIDIGLVPVATLPGLGEYHLAGNYCIGAEGEIASVALFSEVPLPEIEKVYLDYQSRTSAALLQFLMKEYWDIRPEIIRATGEDYRAQIKGTTAGLVIGDRALEQRKISTFIYDLGSEWRKITGLPFVFAVWAGKKKMPDDFVRAFDAWNAAGLEHIDEIVDQSPTGLFDLRKYYKVHLSYRLDEAKLQGMKKFLEVIAQT